MGWSGMGGPWVGRVGRVGRREQGRSKGSFSVQIPHIKVGPEETPRLQYLRFASVSLYPSNEDVSLAVSRILKSFNYPSASLICAKAECEGGNWVFHFLFAKLPSPVVWSPTQSSGASWLECLGPWAQLLVPTVPSPSGTQSSHSTDPPPPLLPKGTI